MFFMVLAPACSWCAGLGLFKTLLVLALMHRYAPDGLLPGVLAQLGSMPIFIGVAVLAAVETVADMWPGRDVQWDRLNGPIRIAGAAVLSAMVAWPQSPFSGIVFAAIGCFLALFSHSARSGARLAAAEAGTNVFVSPVTSVTETCMIFATLLPLSGRPIITLLMLAFTGLASVLVMYLIWPCVLQALRNALFLRTAAGRDVCSA